MRTTTNVPVVRSTPNKQLRGVGKWQRPWEDKNAPAITSSTDNVIKRSGYPIKWDTLSVSKLRARVFVCVCVCMLAYMCMCVRKCVCVYVLVHYVIFLPINKLGSRGGSWGVCVCNGATARRLEVVVEGAQ